MYSVKLRFFIGFNLFCSLIKIESAASQEHLATDIFEPTPAVWRSIQNTPYYCTQASLMDTVISSPPCGKHNRLQAVLHIETNNGTDSSIELERIYKSNHAYSLDGSVELDKETLDGLCTRARKDFKESATQVVSESDPNKASQSLNLHSQKVASLSTALQALISLRALEREYSTFYPFKDVSYQSRLLDSEPSVCRLIESKLKNIEEIYQKTLIRLHMHSDNNSCFYCVQLLHSFAQKWSGETKTPWLIMVSSHQEYQWKGILPHGFESLNKNSMRTFCVDGRHDQELRKEEIQQYIYTPDRPGKIIQVFMHVGSVGAAAPDN